MKKYILFYLILLFSGCGVTDFYTIDGPDDIYDRIPAFDPRSDYAPYDLARFRPVLDRCKLQYPTGTAVPYGKLRDVRRPYFFARDDAVWFVVHKSREMEKIRSELREKGDWHTDDVPGHSWHANLRCFKPKKGVDSYTWMQVHGTDDTFDYPILRLMWVRNYEGRYDHLWAIVIVSDAYVEEKVYEWVDLGKRPGGYFDVDVSFLDNRMEVSVAGKTIISRDVSYWERVANYFKAGVYVNRHDDAGSAAVAFQKLQFLH